MKKNKINALPPTHCIVDRESLLNKEDLIDILKKAPQEVIDEITMDDRILKKEIEKLIKKTKNIKCSLYNKMNDCDRYRFRKLDACKGCENSIT